jgi:hypothetical protein
LGWVAVCLSNDAQVGCKGSDGQLPDGGQHAGWVGDQPELLLLLMLTRLLLLTRACRQNKLCQA